MNTATISIVAFERTAAGRALRVDGLLAGERFAAAGCNSGLPGRQRLDAVRLTLRRVRLAAHAAFVDYALDRPALRLSLDDEHATRAWALAFEEGCRAG